MSFASVMNIARSAIFSHQRAMTITAGNIANAQTPGFTRRRLDLSNSGPWGGVGGNVSRQRDIFLDTSWRREASDFGATSTNRYFLDQIEASVNEPSDTGVSAAINDLFSSFGALGDDPTSDVAREEVRGAAQRLVHHLHRLDQAFNQARARAISQLEAGVEELNGLGEQVAELNGKILTASRTGEAANDLMDERDRLIDQMSGITAIEVLQADDGTTTVMSGGVTLVSGIATQALELRPLEAGGFSISTVGSSVPLETTGGSLKALNVLASATMPALKAQLDRLAREVVGRLNELHQQGVNSAGQTGVDFFDPAGLTAGTISLSSSLLNSSNAIAAGKSGDAGDNGLALEMAGLGSKDLAGLDNRSFESYYAVFVGGLGRTARDAASDDAAAQSLLGHAETWRQSVSGVSVDEEMITLISQQEAFSAAARLVTVADEMMQQILSIGR